MAELKIDAQDLGTATMISSVGTLNSTKVSLCNTVLQVLVNQPSFVRLTTWDSDIW